MWNVIANVTTGITLAAFIAAVAAWVLRAALVRRERLIRAAAESDRAPLIEAELEFFRVDTSSLTKEQKFGIVMEQIRARERRFMAVAKAVTFVTVLLAAVSVFAISRSQPKPTPDERHDSPASPSQGAAKYEVHVYLVGDRIAEEVSDLPFTKQSSPINVGCEQDGSATVIYDVPDGVSVLSHEVRWTDIDNIKSHSANSAVEGRSVVGRGSLRGLDRQFFNCPGGGHATLLLDGIIQRRSETPTATTIEIGSGELQTQPISFTAPGDANLRIRGYRVDLRPLASVAAFANIDISLPIGATPVERTLFDHHFSVSVDARTVKVARREQ